MFDFFKKKPLHYANSKFGYVNGTRTGYSNRIQSPRYLKMRQRSLRKSIQRISPIQSIKSKYSPKSRKMNQSYSRSHKQGHKSYKQTRKQRRMGFSINK
jgi:hypothetical protein